MFPYKTNYSLQEEPITKRSPLPNINIEPTIAATHPQWKDLYAGAIDPTPIIETVDWSDPLYPVSTRRLSLDDAISTCLKKDKYAVIHDLIPIPPRRYRVLPNNGS